MITIGLVHDLSYTNDFSVKVANGHADEGMGSVASFYVNLTVESGILRNTKSNTIQGHRLQANEWCGNNTAAEKQILDK